MRHLDRTATKKSIQPTKGKLDALITLDKAGSHDPSPIKPSTCSKANSIPIKAALAPTKADVPCGAATAPTSSHELSGDAHTPRAFELAGATAPLGTGSQELQGNEPCSSGGGKGTKPKILTNVPHVDDLSETQTLARTILNSPERIKNLKITENAASPPKLPSSHKNEIVDEILNLPTEGVIDNIEKHSSNGAGFYTTITMGDAMHTVLIDTGCTYTLIPRKLFDATGIPFHPVGDIKLRLASGEHFMMGAWVGPITFKVGSQWFNQLIIVTDSGNEMIIGMDFMRRHKTALVISEGIFILNGEPIKLIDENDIKTP